MPERACVPEQHVGPGRGESPGTLTPSNVGLWAAALEHTLAEHYEKDSFGFFPHLWKHGGSCGYNRRARTGGGKWGCEERLVRSSGMKRSAINRSLISISPVHSRFGYVDQC